MAEKGQKTNLGLMPDFVKAAPVMLAGTQNPLVCPVQPTNLRKALTAANLGAANQTAYHRRLSKKMTDAKASLRQMKVLLQQIPKQQPDESTGLRSAE
jgi:hypothetical protein